MLRWHWGLIKAITKGNQKCMKMIILFKEKKDVNKLVYEIIGKNEHKYKSEK